MIYLIASIILVLIILVSYLLDRNYPSHRSLIFSIITMMLIGVSTVAKKDLDEGCLDFIIFEKIQNVYDNYLQQRSKLTEVSVEEALALLQDKI